MGSEGANFLLRLSVERAYCLICPQHSPATEPGTADGESTGTKPVDENRHTKTADPKNAVTVLKADITFFEAAGVETLLHQPSGPSAWIIHSCCFCLHPALHRSSIWSSTCSSGTCTAAAFTCPAAGPLPAATGAAGAREAGCERLAVLCAHFVC